MKALSRKLLLGLALLAAVAGYLWLTGQRIDRAEARASAAETAATDLRSQLAAAQASEHIVTRYVDRVQVIREQGATITREIPVYVTAQADAACTVPIGFVRVHDAAATGAALPGPAGPADAAPSGLALSAVAVTVVDNYASCRASAEQLRALQDWVTANSEPSPPTHADAR